MSHLSRFRYDGGMRRGEYGRIKVFFFVLSVTLEDYVADGLFFVIQSSLSL